MILIIDNYDSFTYNLVQYVKETGYSVKTVRNDNISIKDIYNIKPTHIIISPGPGHPQEASLSLDIITNFAATVPILGVCLGHQSIGHTYGSKIKKLKQPMHGKVSLIYHQGEDIFLNIPSPFKAAHYHSLVIDQNNLANDLITTAKTNEGNIMGCRHLIYPLTRGIQFHPESIWTEYGKQIIKNFLLIRYK